MLVTDDLPAKLEHFLTPVEGEASFVIPLFQHPSSNFFLVQEIGRDGRVVDFRPVNPRSTHKVLPQAQLSQHLNAPAIWGFRHETGDLFFAEREELQKQLRGLVPDVTYPWLKLQIAQFCEDEEQLVRGWRAAFGHLAKQSPRSAEAWRDVVILPAQVRLAVEHAIIAHGLDASVESLGRSVEVNNDGGKLDIRLEEDLHRAFLSHAGALSTLESGMASIREAFDFGGRPLSLRRMNPATAVPRRWPSSLDKAALVAFGNIAINIARSISEHRPPRPRSYDGGARAPVGMPRPSVFLVTADFTQEVPLDEIEILELDNNVDVVYVMFPLGWTQSLFLDAALRFAGNHRAANRQIIAVIPSIPEAITDDSGETDAILSALRGSFASVWMLSDRSPYTRQGLPFGPGHSSSALRSHFFCLLDLVREGFGRQSSDRGFLPISVIGSAVEDRSIARIVDHALKRLAHHLVDYSTVKMVSVRTDSPVPEPLSELRSVINRHAPDADLQLEVPEHWGPGPARVTVALLGARPVPANDRTFAEFCVRTLQGYGWAVMGSASSNPTKAGHVPDVPETKLAFEFMPGGEMSSAMRARPRRQSRHDTFLITNAIIGRRVFALHVLNGQVLIHSSRIDAMERIFQRRYAYALAYLSAEPQWAQKAAVSAALDFFNALGFQDDESSKPLKLTPSTFHEPDVKLQGRELTVALWLEFPKAEPRLATLRLDRDGWRLLALDE